MVFLCFWGDLSNPVCLVCMHKFTSSIRTLRRHWSLVYCILIFLWKTYIPVQSRHYTAALLHLKCLGNFLMHRKGSQLYLFLTRLPVYASLEMHILRNRNKKPFPLSFPASYALAVSLPVSLPVPSMSPSLSLSLSLQCLCPCLSPYLTDYLSLTVSLTVSPCLPQCLTHCLS